MQLHDWAQVPSEQLGPLIVRQMIHSNLMTVARLQLRQGAVVPKHLHINEQISMVHQGRLRFVFDEGEVVVSPGQSLQILSNLPHSVEALEDTIVTDVFSPVREDWLRGDDAYLRAK